MTAKIQAIYEKGVFRPSSPVSLPEGSEVELTVNSGADSVTLAEQLRRIAELPVEGSSEGFSGAEHDRRLYGESPGAQPT